MAEDRLANCRSDKGSSRRLTMISCKPFQNASSTLTLERSTTDDFMARLPRSNGGEFLADLETYFETFSLDPSHEESAPKICQRRGGDPFPPPDPLLPR